MTWLLVFGCGWLSCAVIVVGIYLASVSGSPKVTGRAERPKNISNPGRHRE